MSRIAQALRELTTQAPKGTALIVGDALVVKIANSISSLPEGYSDPLCDKPFTVPPFELIEEETLEMDRYDFTQNHIWFPFGTMNAFLRQKNDETNSLEVVRIPYLMPKFTVTPENDEKEKERELKAAKPENVISIQQNGPIGSDSSGSEISIN
uniref:Uncharacterized protein n=1 Tax=Panagrolaimus davidi TaxID=227884 RepID=A0A914QX93_9BILA